MEIEFKGANCVVLSDKKRSLVIDPNLDKLGLKNPTEKNATILATQDEFVPTKTEAMVINQPGEYEVGNCSITGVAARRLIDEGGSNQATMYRIDDGDTAVAVIGHIAVPLSEEQMEALGVVDIAVVPVGGNGYTLDAHQAVELVRQLDPKIVIPTHFADKSIKYEVDQMELEPFVKELGAAHESIAKLKIKNGALPETFSVIELERTS